MKTLTIAWKDILASLRDRNALLLMLVAPLALSAIMGTALGSLVQGNSTPISRMPIVVVNADQGDMGRTLVEALSGEDLTELIELMLMDDLAGARHLVETGLARAAIYIPPDFTRCLQGVKGETPVNEPRTTQLQLYTDPTKPISSNILRDIVQHIAIIFSSAALSSQVTVEQILLNGIPDPATVAQTELLLSQEIESVFLQENGAHVVLNTVTTGLGNVNPLAFFAPSMAIFFLMFVMFDNTRSILAEHHQGTLARLRYTPTGLGQILLGKLGGSLATGLLQFVVLIAASRLTFNLTWGHSLPGLGLMVVAIVAAASSLGALIAAISKDTTQAAVLGGSITLVFSALGGNFFSTSSLPAWLQVLSRLTINRWALEGLSDLTLRGLGLEDILLEAGILLSLALVLFGLATWQFRRRLAR